MTQPRRVAALTVARRVAEERGVQLGQEVRGAPENLDKELKGFIAWGWGMGGLM